MIRRTADILEQAKAHARKACIAVAGADLDAALETVVEARKLGLANAILVGPSGGIDRAASESGVDISSFERVDTADNDATIAQSLRLLTEGRADILMKGQLPTGDLMRRVLSGTMGFRTNRILSHVAVFDTPGEDRLTILTDAGINIAPDLVRKMDLILNAVDVAHALGMERPRVAMLAFSEKAADPNIPAIREAEMLSKMNRSGAIPGCLVEGPYGLDIAISPEAARIKGIKGEAAGRADVLVAPEIHMAQAIYKTLQIWMKTSFAGTVMGSRVPIVLTSRADNALTKLHSLALGILMRRDEAAK